MSPHHTGRRRAHRFIAGGVPLAVIAALAAAGTAVGAGDREGHARVVRTATLGDIPLSAFSNTLLPGTVVVDLGAVAGVPGKIERIARVDRDTLALISDNDVGMTDGEGAFDGQGRLVDSGVETSVVYVRLPRGI